MDKQVTMTREELMKYEHEIQTGQRDTLPDGTKIADVQKGLQALQEKQTAEDAEKYAQKTEEKTDFLQETVTVHVAENGTISGISAEETQTPVDQNSSDLPEDFPGRKALIAAGVSMLEKVAKLDLDGLKAIPGIGDATAEAILAFGKE